MIVSVLLVEQFLSTDSWPTKHRQKYFLRLGEHSELEGASERHIGLSDHEDKYEMH